MSALKYANAQIYTLLSNPERCVAFLKFLNDELERYFQIKNPGKQFPVIETNELASMVIDGTYYPLPKSDSRYMSRTHHNDFNKKYSALKELLLLLFRAHGIGDEVCKMGGLRG